MVYFARENSVVHLARQVFDLPGECLGRRGLPVEFHTELDTSRGIGGRNRSEIAVSQVGIRLEEVGMVQRVEHLEAELQAPRLAELPPFVNAHIPHEILGRPEIGEESR